MVADDRRRDGRSAPYQWLLSPYQFLNSVIVPLSYTSPRYVKRPGFHVWIIAVTSVAACSPPAPSPTAASCRGAVFVATGAVGGVKEPVGLGVCLTPLPKVRFTVAGDEVLPSRKIATTESAAAPSTKSRVSRVYV